MVETNEKLQLNVKDWIIIALGIMVLLLGIGCGIYYHKYQTADGQVIIWNDSAYIYKNKYNEEYAAKKTYILKIEQLLAYNDELYKEYKLLKDNPIIITKTEVVTNIDSANTNIHNITSNDSLLAWCWDASDKDYYKISGESTANLNDPNSSKTFIENMQVNANLSLDVIDNGNQLIVIAKSDNPYMNLDIKQSVVIDPLSSPTLKNYYKPKHWGLSVYLGAGINIGYDPIHNGFGINFGPSAGIAVTYDLVQW